MPIMNYSTEIPSERTVGEITALLIKKGARSITTDFEDSGELRSISFTMFVSGIPCRFQLPANVKGVASALLRDEPWNPRRQGTRDQYENKLRAKAKWVAWRILKDWVAAQCALIESNQAEAGQAFMPYAIDNSGATMWELWNDSNQKRLTAGEVAQ